MMRIAEQRPGRRPRYCGTDCRYRHQRRMRTARRLEKLAALQSEVAVRFPHLLSPAQAQVRAAHLRARAAVLQAPAEAMNTLMTKALARRPAAA
jgi:hypothetical protein